MLRMWQACHTRLLRHQLRYQYIAHRHARTRAKPAKNTTGSWIEKVLLTGTAIVVGGHVTFTLGSRTLCCDSGGADSLEEAWESQLRKASGEVEITTVAQDLMTDADGKQIDERNTASNDTASAAWATITSTLSTLTAATPSLSITSLLPEWTLVLPSYFQKLRAELSMLPGSLSYELWQESFSPYLNPELQWDARVRLSPSLCDEEQAFVNRRRKFTKKALANYLNIPEKEVNEEDVPVIAMTCSGGGVRAMVSAAGSFWAAKAAGLFDCTTYTAGVSGSCWMQALYLSSLSNASFPRLVDHLRARLCVHFAFPPTALSLLDSAPTNRYLLRGVVERVTRGYTSFGLVDVYGVLLSARLLVPADELGINEDDLKLSNQRRYLDSGQNPLPIYTCVRHEIPGPPGTDKGSEAEKLKAAVAQDWFQWFEASSWILVCYFPHKANSV